MFLYDFFFLLFFLRHPILPLFPYTTLFRSVQLRRDSPRSRKIWIWVPRRVVSDRKGLDLRSRSGGMERRSRPFRSRSEEHTSELQSRLHLVCRLLLEKKKKNTNRKQISHTT